MACVLAMILVGIGTITLIVAPAGIGWALLLSGLALGARIPRIARTGR